MKNSKLQGHIAIITANVIFGLSVPMTTDLVTRHFTPFAYMLARCVGAAVIFWCISLALPRERVPRRDLLVIIGGGLLGFAVSQTLTAFALAYTTPVYYSLVATLVPIAVLVLAWMWLSERMTRRKLIGVILGVAGAMLMVAVGWNNGSGANDALGITLALGSLITWAVYLILTQRVSARYTAVTQMKWMFLSSSVAVLPFVWSELPEQPILGADTPTMWLGIGEMAFVVVFATVLGYFFIPYAMKRISATIVSVYTNLQPVVASVVAFAIGQDTLTWDKPVAAALVLLSAYLVTVQKNTESKGNQGVKDACPEDV